MSLLKRLEAETAGWFVLCGCIVGITLFDVVSCASLAPGADPLVVRVEQVESDSLSTFTLVLNVDNNDRGFWRTNAPAFHNFCEWLREPVGQLPRDLEMVQQLDQIKLAYKSASATSNSVYIVLSTVLAAANQASAWLTITTNSVSIK